MEQLASFAYSCILENALAQSRFIDEKKQGQYWNLPDNNKKSTRGRQLDWTLINRPSALPDLA
jgi:hypothetical protein